MYIFLSPHFDDAIGSAGGTIEKLIKSGEECCIMTFMTAVPWSRIKSSLYVLRRRRENQHAAKVLNCNIENAPFFDAVYRKGISKAVKLSKKHLFTAEITEQELVKHIRDYILIHTVSSDILIAPAGLGNHIDHRIVNRAVQGLDRTIYFYEEFFYDIQDKNPELTAGYKYVFLSPDETNTKLHAMLKYKKTLRKLFGKNWKVKTNEYFIKTRVCEGKAYERFNNTDFLNEK